MTKIEWATESWNPIQDKRKGKQGRGYHCTKRSPGCDNCYAETTNILRGNGLPFDNRPAEFEIVEKTLEKPLHWRKPRRVFVQSMGDLFHGGITDKQINDVIATMTHHIFGVVHHTYLILTKRPERILKGSFTNFAQWKNIWLGVTAENQEQADKRIPILLQIPAAVRFVSVEPMLSPIDISKYLSTPEAYKFLSKFYGTEGFDPSGSQEERKRKLDWVICGGESGKNARPMHPDWARSLRDQCQPAGVPFFFKQWGEWAPSYDVTIQNVEFVPGRQEIPYTRGGELHKVDGTGNSMIKVGKKKAGRLLDGREWNEYPEVK